MVNTAGVVLTNLVNCDGRSDGKDAITSRTNPITKQNIVINNRDALMLAGRFDGRVGNP
jgi:hypothetical protein